MFYNYKLGTVFIHKRVSSAGRISSWQQMYPCRAQCPTCLSSVHALPSIFSTMSVSTLVTCGRPCALSVWRVVNAAQVRSSR
ncbi:hypothetical protein C8Q70DRAFT_943824 [Cubamyces menziesii]|nr:hypothetical protein C8Q70DRAFT_943824 [Cubamyces menziesii]